MTDPSRSLLEAAFDDGFKLGKRAGLALRAEAVHELRAALAEAIEGYEYACEYKGDYFVKKHGDKEAIAKCRAVLARYPEEPSRA